MTTIDEYQMEVHQVQRLRENSLSLLMWRNKDRVVIHLLEEIDNKDRFLETLTVVPEETNQNVVRGDSVSKKFVRLV